ncbi:MAG: DUF4255 domain-containing protein [Anaerolineaceae bacterium]|nr:DUF4255 domain-containing protein [Anaerolineaceae bacterium]
MIYELNETLRELLMHEMPVRKGDVDIQFDLPKREWSSRLSKPTLNLYMYDILENIELRGSEQWTQTDNGDGTVTIHRNPVRVNFYYLITSWAKEIQDEQQLLSAALTTLLRQPSIPEELLPVNLKNQPVPIRLEVGQNKSLAKLSDFWGTIDNDPHPGIRLTVTLTIDPYKAITSPRVATSEVRFKQNPSPNGQKLEDSKSKLVDSKSYFSIRGKLVSQKYSPTTLKLFLKETGKEVSILDEGEFAIQRLVQGTYHLDIIFNDRVLRHEKFVVPASYLEIKV